MENREFIEWSNTWIENADDTSIDRIALIGDSVSRGYRSSLNETLLLMNNCVVDLCACSHQITDPMTEKLIRFFLDSDYRYKCVVFQLINQHGLGIECNEQYIEAIGRIVEVIKEYCGNVVVLSGTPAVMSDNLTLPDSDRNSNIESRNRILQQVAKRYSLQFVDIFDFCKRPYLNHIDRVHFDKYSNHQIAKKLYMEYFSSFTDKNKFDAFLLNKLSKRIFIYGAGAYGRHLYELLLNIGCTISGFVQTVLNADEVEIYGGGGIRIISFDEFAGNVLVNESDMVIVVIAIGDDNQANEVLNKLMDVKLPKNNVWRFFAERLYLFYGCEDN